MIVCSVGLVMLLTSILILIFIFVNDTTTSEFYSLTLDDALAITFPSKVIVLSLYAA